MKKTAWCVVLLLVSCKAAEVKPEAAPPTLAAEDLIVVNQSLTDCAVRYAGSLEATTEPATIEKAVFEFVVDGTVLKTGEKAVGVQVAPGAKGDFTLEEKFTYVKDLDALKAMDARGGSLLLAMRGHLVVQVGGAELEVPFAHSREVRTPRLPHVKMIEFEAGRFSETEVQVTFHVGVINPNPFEISINGLDYAVTLANKQVGQGKLGAGDRVSAATTGVFDIAVTMNEETHGADTAKLIKGLLLPYDMKGKLVAAMGYEEALSATGQVKLNKAK
jgi:LEA14-like dessication related protein